MTERQIPLHLACPGFRTQSSICYLFLLELSTEASKNPCPSHIGTQAFWKLETLRRNAINGMHAYRRFTVLDTEERKRVYENIIREYNGKSQGKLGCQRLP